MKKAQERGIQTGGLRGNCKLRIGLEQQKSSSPTGKVWPELRLEPREMSRAHRLDCPVMDSVGLRQAGENPGP